MEVNQCVRLIDNISAAITALVKAGRFEAGEEAIVNAGKVLYLLKAELIRRPQQMNERVLRATIDLAMSAYKDFEQTPVEKAIDALVEWLYQSIPAYKDMEPLRGEFNQGDPV